MADYAQSKGRASQSSFVALPRQVLNHPNFVRLSFRATKLFLNIYGQYGGFNNGDFCAPFSLMKNKGFKSNETLSLAINELLHYGLIITTRKGGRNKICSLFAVTFQPIDECKGKLDQGIRSTKNSGGEWKEEKPDWSPPEWYVKSRNKKHKK